MVSEVKSGSWLAPKVEIVSSLLLETVTNCCVFLVLRMEVPVPWKLARPTKKLSV